VVAPSGSEVTDAPSRRHCSRESAGPRHAAAFALYGSVVCAMLLPKLLPGHPRQILSNSPADGAIFLWSLGWWSHAIGHGDLLPYTHAVFAPGGTNLAWTTSIPLPSLLLVPVTHVFGIFAAFNILALLAPVTAAWATYLLVHRVTGRWLASLAAGLLFALSPLEMTEVAIGHVNVSLTALIPLGAYLLVRQLEGSISPRIFVSLLGLVLAAELGVSTEVFATATLFGLIALLLLYAWDRDRRPALRRCARLVGLGYVLAGIIASPILYAALALPHPADLASTSRSPMPMSGVRTLVPHTSALRSGLLHPSRNDSLSAVLLLVLPLAAILLHMGWRRRREPVLRALAATAALALACSVGILVVGSTTLPTPWALAMHVPLLRLVRPQRFTAFFWLAASVGVGVWLAERPRAWRRWAAAALVVATTLPVLWWGSWTSVIPPSPFRGAAEPSLASSENVLVLTGPAVGSGQFDDLAFPTVWQAESGFSFRLADAYVGSFPPPLPASVRRLVFDDPLLPGDGAALMTWFRRAGVGAIVLMRPTPPAVSAVQDLLGTAPMMVGGVALFSVGDQGA
jgi:hypothetical protein